MMKLTVNGKDLQTEGDPTVQQLLQQQKVKSIEMVSVELNGEILDRTLFAHTRLKEGDCLEFLYFMGGGHGAQ